MPNSVSPRTCSSPDSPRRASPVLRPKPRLAAGGVIGHNTFPMTAKKDSGLNPAQKKAVEHGDGPLLVLAGPGSGKTRVVTHRIARLIERGVPARNLLAVTFTNKAARAMRDRVRKLASDRGRGLTVATFHSACCRILREEIHHLGYGRDFSIYDQGSQESLMRSILREFDGLGATRSASTVLEVGAAALAVPRARPAPAQERASHEARPR